MSARICSIRSRRSRRISVGNDSARCCLAKPTIVDVIQRFVASQDLPHGAPCRMVKRNCARVHVVPLNPFQSEMDLRGNVAKVNRKQFIEYSIQNSNRVVAFRTRPFGDRRERKGLCWLATKTDHSKLAARSQSPRELEPNGSLLADRKLRTCAFSI